MSSLKVIKSETFQRTSLCSCSLSVISSVLAVSLLLTAPTAAHANDLVVAEEAQRLLKSLDRLKRDLDLAETNRLMSERYYGIAPPTPESVTGMPAGMGGIPASANMPQFDTSGFRLGYCTFTPNAANSFLEYAIISAGQDGIIQTSCANIQAGVVANILANAPTGLNLAVAGSSDRIKLSHHNETASTQWSASVDNISALPTVAQIGDIRLVEDTNEIMVFSTTGWKRVITTEGSAFDEATNTTTFGNTYNTGTLRVDGQTTLRNLAVTGSSVFGNALTANGGIRADDGTLEIASTANLASGLNVAGNSLFSNLVTVNNTLDVNGLVDANSLNVSGPSTLNTTNINGVASFNNQANFNNQTNFNNRTDFNSLAYFNAGLTAAGTSNFQNITVANNTTTGSLNVNSNAVVNGTSNLNVLNVNGAANFNNMTYLNATTRANAPVHLLNSNGLYFGENFENSDTIAMYRRNVAGNRTDLVLQLGDDHTDGNSADHFVIQGGHGGHVAIRGDGNIFTTGNLHTANDVHANRVFTNYIRVNGTSEVNHLHSHGGGHIAGALWAGEVHTHYNRVHGTSEVNHLYSHGEGHFRGKLWAYGDLRVAGEVVDVHGYVTAHYLHGRRNNWTSSDRRLKENIIKNDSISMLEKLSKLSSYDYNYIGQDDKVTGVIAQEVQGLFPHVAKVMPGMNTLSVDYSALGSMAAAGVGHLYGEVKSLQGWKTQAANTLVNHDGRITGLESWRTTAINQLTTLDGRVGSLEVWQHAAQSDMELMRTIIDQNVTQIAEHALKISNLEENVADNTAEIIRLDSVLLDITDRTVSLEEQFTEMNKKWADSFTVTATESGAGSSMKVNYNEFIVKNLTADVLQANQANFDTLAANNADVVDLNVSNKAVAKQVQADTVNSGSSTVTLYGLTDSSLFKASQDGHYMVMISGKSLMTGEQYYTTATVLVNGGKVEVVPQKSKGVGIYADAFGQIKLSLQNTLNEQGDIVSSKAPNGTSFNVSWLKTS